MLEWLDRTAGPAYTQAVFWTLLALLMLLVVLVAIRIFRNMTFGTYVAGGRNRKTRLAVMDATALDSHRRLVLVRRDDIEHLLLIGGPTDVVVERDIRLAQTRRSSASSDPALEPPQPPAQAGPALAPPPATAAARPAELPRPQVQPVRPPSLTPPPRVLPERAPATLPPRTAEARAPVRNEPRPAGPPVPPAPAATGPLPVAPAPSGPPAPSMPLPQKPGAAPAQPAQPKTPVVQQDELDDALLKELEVSLDGGDVRGPKASSLDDEMAKLLGELSTPRR